MVVFFEIVLGILGVISVIAVIGCLFTKRLGMAIVWLGTAIFAFVFLNTLSPTPAPAVEQVIANDVAQQTADAEQMAQQLTSDLIEHMYQNHSSATWYPLIETFGVSVDLSERTLSVRAETIFPPQDATSRPVVYAAGALMSWAFDVEQDKQLTLSHLMVYGRKAGGELVELRGWDELWGWRNW